MVLGGNQTMTKPSEYIMKKSDELKSKMINIPQNEQETLLVEFGVQLQAIKCYLDKEYNN